MSNSDDEEGLIHSPKENDDNRDHRFDPESLDFTTWKAKVGSLIRSEHLVMMHNDDELRNAISQAVFLEAASQNLLKKRKRQLEILEECRADEGVFGKKLLEENEECVQRMYGPAYHAVTNEWRAAFEKASRPIETPDVRRPPPHMMLPPMNIPPPMDLPPSMKFPPPPFLNIPKNIPIAPSTSSVTSALSKAFITSAPRAPIPLMSQHLLPPSVESFHRSDLKKEIKEEPNETHENEVKNTKSLAPGDLNTSWRMPYHPIPVPPPRKVLPFSIPPPLFQRNTAASVLLQRANENEKSSSPVKALLRPPASPPGLIGVNVHGVFIGESKCRRLRE